MKKILFFLLLILSITLTSCGEEPKVDNSQSSNSNGDNQGGNNPVDTPSDPQTNPDVKYFTVEFIVEGRVIYTCKVAEGKSATPPEIDPSEYGVIFKGWDTEEYLCVTKDLKVNAKVESMEGEYFTVEFYVYDELVAFYRVLKGERVEPPTIDFNKYEGEFVGWDTDEYSCVEKDLVINAIFAKNEPMEVFLVQFYFKDELLYSAHVPYGTAVEAPLFNASKYHVEFLGWSSNEYTYVTKDLVIDALYEELEMKFYLNIDGEVINPNTPLIIFDLSDLDFISLEDFNYNVPFNYSVKWDLENIELNEERIGTLFGELVPNPQKIYLNFDGNLYKTIDYDIENLYRIEDLLIDVQQLVGDDITLESLYFYVESYEYVLEMLNLVTTFTINIYPYCYVENEAVFYVNNQYYGASFYPANDPNSIIYPTDYEILNAFGYYDTERYMVHWYNVEHNKYNSLIYGEIIERPSEFVIKFVYNDQEKTVIYDYNTAIHEVMKEIRYYFTAEEGYDISWDFVLEYSPNEQIVYPIVTLREYEIRFYDQSYNVIYSYQFTIEDEINVTFPEVPTVDGKVGHWPNVTFDEYKDYDIAPIYETYYQIPVIYQDFDDEGNYIFEDRESIYFLLSDIKNMTKEEFKAHYNFDTRFALEDKPYFKQIDYTYNFDYWFDNVKEMGYVGEGLNILYGYELEQWSIGFVTEEPWDINDDSLGVHIYTQYVTYTIFTDLSNIEIPNPGRFLHHTSSWSQFEFFKEKETEVNQINTPIIHEINFNDNGLVKTYEYNLYLNDYDNYIQIRLGEDIVYDGKYYKNNNYTYEFDDAADIRGYDGNWEEFKLFSNTVLNVDVVYTLAEYTLEFYVPYSPGSTNYQYHSSVTYTLENYHNITLPEVEKFAHYKYEWDLVELFEEKTQVIYLRSEIIVYKYEFYVNNEYVETQEVTVEDPNFFIPLVGLAGYDLDCWYVDGKKVEFNNLELNNYRFDAYRTPTIYTLTYTDINNEVIGTKTYTIEEPAIHLNIPELEGLEGEWVIFNEKDSFIPVVYDGRLGDFTLKASYTSIGATEGLVYRPLNDDWDNYTAIQVVRYEGDGKSIVVPEIYNNFPVTHIYYESFKDLELDLLDIRHLNVVNGSFKYVDTLIINEYTADTIYDYGIVKHLEIHSNTGYSTYPYVIDYAPKMLETLIINGTNIKLGDNYFVGLDNLTYLEIKTLSNENDGFNTLTQNITVRFIDLYAYLIYHNSPIFNDNVEVYVGDALLSTFTEIVIPDGVSYIAANKFKCTNVEKVSFAPQTQNVRFGYGEGAFDGVVELDMSNVGNMVNMSGNGLETVKKLILPTNCLPQFDEAFTKLTLEEVYIKDLDQLLSYEVSPLKLDYSVKIFVDGTLYERKPYIILDNSYTKTSYNFSEFGFVVYENSNVEYSDIRKNYFIGTNYYFVDGIFYTVEDEEAIVLYIAEQIDARILDNIVVDGKVYPVTTIGNRAVDLNSVTNLYLGDNIRTTLSQSFAYGIIENVHAPSLEMYCAISSDSISQEGSPTARGSNLYINGELLTTFTSLEGQTHIPSGLFYNCTSLTKVILEEGVQSIGNEAFTYTNLTDIYLPKSLEFIGYLCFGTIERVHIADLEIYAQKVEYGTLYGGTHVIETPFDSGAKLYVGDQMITELNFSENITKINAFSFRGLYYVTKVYVPQNCVVGKNAFDQMPDLIEYIGPELS